MSVIDSFELLRLLIFESIVGLWNMQLIKLQKTVETVINVPTVFQLSRFIFVTDSV
jgi:hypothetical protein